jgi:hypothetical protein
MEDSMFAIQRFLEENGWFGQRNDAVAGAAGIVSDRFDLHAQMLIT